MRNITVDMANGLSDANVTPILFSIFEFDSQTIGMWTGYGVFNWEGYELHGGGNFIGISPINETQDIEAKGVVLSLNGIASDLVATALTEHVKNRPMRTYLALMERQAILDPDTGFPILNPDTGEPLYDPAGGYTFVDEPYRIFSGLMDTFEIADSAKTADIRLSVENVLLIGQRAKISRYTDEQQRKYYPSDVGLNFINRLQDREVVW